LEDAVDSVHIGAEGQLGRHYIEIKIPDQVKKRKLEKINLFKGIY
jgi:hypothetical protein